MPGAPYLDFEMWASREARPLPPILTVHRNSKGHGFSRAINSRVEDPTLLPQAGVQPQAKR